jgi:NAD(P)-dependent dehydrogenase (short-subunit alcohol dehydrogenase family)
VTDATAVRKAVTAIEALHGHLDIVVNNAGIQRRARWSTSS